MATYKEIQAYVKEKYGFQPKTCWIAHMKEVCGISSFRGLCSGGYWTPVS